VLDNVPLGRQNLRLFVNEFLHGNQLLCAVHVDVKHGQP